MSALVTKDNKIFVVRTILFILEIAVLKHDRAQANAGDSRVVLSMKGQVKPLSFDHKPGNECSSSLMHSFFVLLTWSIAERKRILAAGGYIEFGRVNGSLSAHAMISHVSLTVLH